MRILRRVAYWLRLSSHDADLLNEVEFHRAMVEEDLVRRGMSPAAARIEARRTMGNDTVIREESRAVWLWPSLEALWQDATYTVRMGEGTRVRNVAIVSAAFFDFFDAPPVLGRYFTASEDAPPDPAPVTVLSHGLWTTQFGARRDVLGATLRIDAGEYTIIGVAPEKPRFRPNNAR